MKITLPDQRIVQVMCKHTEIPRKKKGVYRRTEMSIQFPDGEIRSGMAECSPADHFTYTKGRRLALNKLFADDSAHTLKELADAERQFLVKKLCSHIFLERPTVKKGRQALNALRKAKGELENGLLPKMEDGPVKEFVKLVLQDVNLALASKQEKQHVAKPK